MTERVDPSLTPEEQAQVLTIQERLIELLVSQGEAATAGDRNSAAILQDEIDDLLRQREHIRIWAAADGK